jgi:hypothetical protein
MKRIIFAIVIMALLAVSVSLTAKRIILNTTKKVITEILPGSEVSIHDCRISPLHRVRWDGIKIQRKGTYKFEIGKAAVDFNLMALLFRRIARISLEDAYFAVTLAEENRSGFRQYVHSAPGGSGGMTVDGLVLHNINMDVNAKDLKLNASLSVDYSFASAQINAVELNISFLESRGMKLQKISMRLGEPKGRGKVTVERIKFNKGMIDGIDGIVGLEGRTVFLDFLSAGTFGGRLKGRVSLNISERPEYFVALRFTDMAIDRFVEDFDLEEKFFMDGELSGDLVLQGKGADVQILNGDFQTGLSGGKLIIKDTRFMEALAKQTNQPVEIIVENFKNYHYNTGALGLSLAEKNIVLDLALDGDTGKRNLTITLHDFLSKKDGI